jgi:hypothetical protein
MLFLVGLCDDLKREGRNFKLRGNTRQIIAVSPSFQFGARRFHAYNFMLATTSSYPFVRGINWTVNNYH